MLPDRDIAKRVLLFVPLAAMMVNLGQSVLFATMPILGRSLNFSELQVTSLVSLSALTYFLLSPYWGRYSDLAGRKKVILIGLCGYFTGTLLFNGIITLALAGITGGTVLYLLLLPYRVAHTSLMAATHPAGGAYVADVTSVQDRTKGMAMQAAAIAFGAMLGPAFVYFARFGLLVPLYMTAIACFVAFILLLYYLPDYRVGQQQAGEPPRPPVRLSYFDPRFRSLLVIGLVMYTSMSIVMQTLGFYFQDRLGLPPLEAINAFAVANMLSSAAMLFAQLVFVRKSGWAAEQLMRFGLPFIAIGYLGLALGDSQLMFNLAMMSVGLGMGTAGPGYTASASLRVERHEQGALAGLAGSIPGLGFVIGPLVGGFLYQINSAWPYFWAFCMMTLLAVYTMIFSLSAVRTEVSLSGIKKNH